MGQIKNAWLILTYSCNNSCDYCYAQKMVKRREFVELAFAKQVLDELARIRVECCLLIGGEPTLHKDLFEIVSYGAHLGLEMKIVSNGRKFKDRQFVQNLVSAGISHISISLEGSTAQLHDRICGARSFAETLQGLKNCVDSGVALNSVATISKGNRDDLVNIARLVHAVGVRNILFNYGLPPVSDENEDVFISPQELANAAIAAYHCLREEGIRVRFFGTIPVCTYGKEIERMVTEGYISGGTGCHMFTGAGIAIEPTGKVIPCTHFVDTELFSCSGDNGKTFQLSGRLDKIWNEVDGPRMRFQELLRRYPSSECEDCRLWGKCRGGCPLLWKQFDPRNYTYRQSVSTCFSQP